MPNYKLKNNGVDCGQLIVSNAGGSPSWSYQAPGGSSNTISPQPTYTGSNAMNPSVGDTLTLPTTFSTSVNNGNQDYPGTATYAAATTGPNGKKAGFYRQASKGPGGSVGDWDAVDDGSGK
jgi:hypothetical protein